jgi:hypothetical protein
MHTVSLVFFSLFLVKECAKLKKKHKNQKKLCHKNVYKFLQFTVYESMFYILGQNKKFESIQYKKWSI